MPVQESLVIQLARAKIEARPDGSQHLTRHYGGRVEILGIDIGGSGIKGAPVHIGEGRLVRPRHRIPTPKPSTPGAVAKTVAAVAAKFNWQGPIGVTFPAIVQHGVALSAANVDPTWIGVNAQELFAAETGRPVVVLNDADAAGLAEMEFGAGRGHPGVVLVLTFGTGIGSALFVDGRLVPNTELGHLEIRGKDAEHRASAKVMEDRRWTWGQWAKRANEFLGRLDALFSPDLFIVGGGISKEADGFVPLLKARAPIVAAQLKNEAGIVGAAVAAQELAAPTM